MPKALVIKQLSNNGVPANTGDVIELTDASFTNLSRKGWVKEYVTDMNDAQDEQPQTKKRRN
jgi:hypothetical protein